MEVHTPKYSYIEKNLALFTEKGASLEIVNDVVHSYITQLDESGKKYKQCAYCQYQADIKYGDIDDNDIVNSTDAVLVKQYLAGYDIEQKVDAVSMDVNGDGKIDSLDAVLLMQKLAGYDVNFAN